MTFTSAPESGVERNTMMETRSLKADTDLGSQTLFPISND